MKKLALVLFSLLIICSASAIELKSYDAEVTLSEDGAYEKIILFANYSGEENIGLTLPPDINNLIVEINGVRTKCEQKTVLGATKITCPVNFKSDYYLEANFNTNYVVVDLDGRFLFKQKVTPDASIEKLSFRLKLPETGMVSEPIGNYITPAPTSIYSDGRVIILLFEKENIESNFEISVIYEKLVPDIIFPIIITSIVLIGSISLIILYGKKKKPKVSKEEILLEDEKKIVNILNEAGKPIRQKDIEKQVDFSKAKLSRVLRHLEERGILKRTPLGNTNIIEFLK